MNSQIEDKSESSKPRFIFEEHNDFIKREPSIDEELHSLPTIKTVKTEQIEETQNINNDPHFPIEANLNFPFEIQAKCLQTFVPELAKISKHHTIDTNENDNNFIIPDLKVENEFPIETKPVIVKIEFEPIENIEIKTVKNVENESERDDNLCCDNCDFKTKDLPKLVSHTNKCYYKIPFAVPTVNKIKGVKNGNFACDHCEHQTSKKGHLIVHIKAWHMQKKGERLNKGGIHKLMPTNKKKQQRAKLTCNLCTCKLSSVKGLKNHYRCSHNKTSIELICNNCGESFPQKSELVVHIEAKMCEDIVIANTEADVIDTHSAKNSGKKHLINQLAACPVGYRCDQCSYKGKNMCTLKKHMKIHAKQPKKSVKKHHSCQFCKYKSLSEYDLNEHMLKNHKHEKPYFCKLCDCKYSHMDNLVKHIKSHFLRR